MSGRPPRGTGRVGRQSPSPATAARDNPERQALRRALQRLARRDQSSSQLRRALAREGLEPEHIERALERLGARRLLDDVAFAERFSRRSLARGLGRKRIGIGLAARGISRDDARRGLEQALEVVPELPALEQLAGRYWQRHARLAAQQRARRLFAFLLRRGFPAASIVLCMRSICPEHSESIEGLANDD